MAHAHEDASRGSDTGKRAGEHADESAEVDEGSEGARPGEIGEDAHGSGGFAQVLMGGVHAESFEVSAEDEEEAGEDGALDDCAGDGAEWVGGFGSEGCGALEADEAEEGEDDA